MTTLTKTVGAQWPMVASFEFDIADSDAMENTSGTSTAFSAASGTTYDVMSLPYGSVVIGGDVVVKTVSDDTGTATISVGDSASATRYASTVDMKSAARTALTITGYETAVEKIRLTLANQNGNATTGNVRVNVMFIVNGRQLENLKTT